MRKKSYSIPQEKDDPMHSHTLSQRFASLVEVAEQAVVEGNNLTKTELLSVVQNIYAQLMRMSPTIPSVNLTEGHLPANAEMIRSLRQVVMKQTVADLLQDGWFLDTCDRKYELKNGETQTKTYYRMRKWIMEGGVRKRLYKYIGRL